MELPNQPDNQLICKTDASLRSTLQRGIFDKGVKDYER